jgi:hypothetical protein
MKQDTPINRAEKTLALILLQSLKGSTEANKAMHLSLGGFTAVEIADLLQTTAAVVRQHLYTARKKGKKSKKIKH